MNFQEFRDFREFLGDGLLIPRELRIRVPAGMKKSPPT